MTWRHTRALTVIFRFLTFFKCKTTRISTNLRNVKRAKLLEQVRQCVSAIRAASTSDALARDSRAFRPGTANPSPLSHRARNGQVDRSLHLNLEDRQRGADRGTICGRAPKMKEVLRNLSWNASGTRAKQWRPASSSLLGRGGKKGFSLAFVLVMFRWFKFCFCVKVQ